MNLFERIGLMFLLILAMNGIAWVLSKINHTSFDSAMILVLVGVVSAMATFHRGRYRSTGGTVV